MKAMVQTLCAARPKRAAKIVVIAMVDDERHGDCHILCPVSAGFCTDAPYCLAFGVHLERGDNRRVLRCGECIAEEEVSE